MRWRNASPSSPPEAKLSSTLSSDSWPDRLSIGIKKRITNGAMLMSSVDPRARAHRRLSEAGRWRPVEGSISAAWFLLQTCVFVCCLFFVFLFLNPECLDTPRLDLDGLGKALRQRIIGQDVALNRMVGAISRYLDAGNFSSPLVLVFVGCSGCGKTYAVSIVAKQYEFAETIVASHRIALARKLRDDLGHWLRRTVSSWRPNLIAVDDFDLEDDSMRRQLQAAFASWDRLEITAEQPTVFILVVTNGADIAEGFALRMLSDGRPMNGSRDVAMLVSAYRDVLPRWMRDFEVVPFLPMTRDDVKECFRRELSQMKAGIEVPDDKLERLMEEIAFYPPESLDFSESGCKEVPIKLALNFP
ncbi:torsin, putative [Ixodes scapularis]|uniref:Torsin, putative n=1 Tax=Ixodes scapularis TaxID=6945 RepID=B7PA07_IXOSC|nr:torsin, putative [Ixodes scapularis]|eukprot:XP_002405990.1 torsin, putative [Ixodes scapularis]